MIIDHQIERNGMDEWTEFFQMYEFSHLHLNDVNHDYFRQKMD